MPENKNNEDSDNSNDLDIEVSTDEDNEDVELQKSNVKIEYKKVSFEVKSVESSNISIISGEPGNFGIIKGYALTYGNIDRGSDVIMPGAFVESLQRHKKNKRPVRMGYQHRDLIGGFPIKEALDEDKGLFLIGEVNKDVPEGASGYALAKQGVLTDLSIGFSIIDEDIDDKKGIRKINKAELWEVSLVSEPMNPKAVITEVKDIKGATSFKDLPLADRGMAWGKSEALKRVREKTGSTEKPSGSYRNAFFWFDSGNADNFGAYKLPFVDVVNGQLKAVPRGIFAAAAAMRGARGGVDIPAADKGRVTAHINKYYNKMGLTSPLKSKSIEYLMTFDDEIKIINNYDVEDVEHIVTQKSFEDLLKDSGVFSRKAATYFAKFFNPQTQSESVSSSESKQSESVEDEEKSELILQKLNELKNLIEKFAEINNVSTRNTNSSK
jgi:HK97 family phage prohead protease